MRFYAIYRRVIAEVSNLFEFSWNVAAIFGKLREISYSNGGEIVKKSPLVKLATEVALESATKITSKIGS